MSRDKSTVLIVGAGLGGLVFGALLEKLGFHYNILERAAVVKPLGSAMSIGPMVLPVFKQLGIYDEFIAMGKPFTHFQAFKESLEPYSPLPSHKIHFGKRFQSIGEKNDKITIHTTDDGTYEGDILVGADSAYSAVQQSMYDQLKAEGTLPQSDQEDLPFIWICLTMCDETRNFKIPAAVGMKTMGDLYDLTPKDLISTVMLEEKVFETWHSGRTVLLGDAHVTSADITKVFQECYDKRYPAAVECFQNSQLRSKITDRGIFRAIVLYLYTHMPFWLWRMMLVKLIKFRPQAGFLKAIEVKRTVVPEASPSERKARTVFEKQQQVAGSV
ncbi:hypothetical protein BGW39_007674 [Mortierella sp. 14UC]|nr:hypothetical protein BGW39_007674 [Mortierella sp. 14UC]